ncbi:hypothetical protein [Cryobacterium sp. SO1]|uniref:hypothetical protein n=1 Tax=Cryobacterium sp. SO1 TaxID=1897061 RepID=UPI0010230736|nr:hypothetical protein [Cryobacterium sp. SO1]RZI34753.1 hypothetical protein BJQ95_02807 [Cryobacterium sp. SO1]
MALLVLDVMPLAYIFMACVVSLVMLFVGVLVCSVPFGSPRANRSALAPRTDTAQGLLEVDHDRAERRAGIVAPWQSRGLRNQDWHVG